jgi:hypothetical protein
MLWPLYDSSFPPEDYQTSSSPYRFFNARSSPRCSIDGNEDIVEYPSREVNNVGSTPIPVHRQSSIDQKLSPYLV